MGNGLVFLLSVNIQHMCVRYIFTLYVAGRGGFHCHLFIMHPFKLTLYIGCLCTHQALLLPFTYLSLSAFPSALLTCKSLTLFLQMYFPHFRFNAFSFSRVLFPRFGITTFQRFDLLFSWAFSSHPNSLSRFWLSGSWSFLWKFVLLVNSLPWKIFQFSSYAIARGLFVLSYRLSKNFHI